METVTATGKRIVEYSATEAGLAALREKFKSLTFDVTSKDGMKAARAARGELRTLRTSLEAKRKEVKSDALAHCQRVDAEARRITKEIAGLEDPIAAQIDAHEAKLEAEREAAAKADLERRSNIHMRILAIEVMPAHAAGADSGAIAKMVEQANADEPESWAQEFLPQAQQALLTTRAQLAKMHAAAIAAERAELERQQAAQRAADDKARLEREEAERQHKAKMDEEERAARARREEEDRKAREAHKAEEARLSAERAAEDARFAAARRQIEDERAALEREKLEKELAEKRAAEEAAAKQRAEEEAARRVKEEAERAEREKAAAAERERQRAEQELLDARGALESFVERFEHLVEFGAIAKAITAFLKARK